MVGVHDGVRPFVSQEVIARCFREAAVRKAVIPVIDVVETVRHLTGSGSETVNRNDYKLVQTPQVFDADLLRRAYEQEFTPFFTDDASVVEAMGVPVHLVEGNRENIKITTPFDLKVHRGGALRSARPRHRHDHQYGRRCAEQAAVGRGGQRDRGKARRRVPQLRENARRDTVSRGERGGKDCRETIVSPTSVF